MKRTKQVNPFIRILSSSKAVLLLFAFAINSLYTAAVLGALPDVPQYATPLNRWRLSEMSLSNVCFLIN